MRGCLESGVGHPEKRRKGAWGSDIKANAGGFEFEESDRWRPVHFLGIFPKALDPTLSAYCVSCWSNHRRPRGSLSLISSIVLLEIGSLLRRKAASENDAFILNFENRMTLVLLSRNICSVIMPEFIQS